MTRPLRNGLLIKNILLKPIYVTMNTEALMKKKKKQNSSEYGKTFTAGVDAAAKMYQEAKTPVNTNEVVEAIIKQLKAEKDYF